MKFGPIAVEESEGALLAHAIRNRDLVLQKGKIITVADIVALKAAGLESIIAAKLDAKDVHEDKAAHELATRLAGLHVKVEMPFTGRCNILSCVAGIAIVEPHIINRINAIDEAITVATLTPFRPVHFGETVATIKIIPFAVPSAVLGQVLREAAQSALRVAPFRPLRVGVISTILPGFKPSIVAKTLCVLETRLALAGATIETDCRAPHEVSALAAAIREAARGVDALVIFGASAIIDRRDVIPTAIETAGGTVLHFGMPVDPGNLLLLGRLPMPSGDSIPVVGAPGCARSPKENGFDFVLQRILSGELIDGSDLRYMGVGGLLSEIRSRPQPRNRFGPAP